ncbi:AAA family ATPase [Streptomyces sp. NBC_01007]|nr:AAA family ATPase [Streptomyces sp. NBC_01007]WRZ95691.1 AAA family ATPase [Streptomyces sp. NBC_01007]
MTVVCCRTAAIDILEEAFANCAAGTSGSVLIEGPTGCGKSALVHSVVERATAHGALVLNAVGLPAERRVSYGVLRQLVGSDRTVTPPALPAGPAVPARVADMQVFCAELGALSETAPVVLCVDDVQYADAESLAFLEYVSRHARADRVLLVVSDCPHHEPGRPEFTTELMRRPAFRRVRLGRLTAEEVAEVAGRYRRPAPAAVLYGISGGNPLLLRALLEEQGADGHVPVPGGPFAQAVRACLHRMGACAAGVAQAAAVLDTAATAERITTVLGAAPDAVRRAMAALESAGLLDGVRLRHPALRAAVFDGLAPAVRRDLHRGAAVLLHAQGVPVADAAGHLLAADVGAGGRWQATPGELDLLAAAADARLAVDDARQAARLLELALRTCDDAQRRGALDLRLARIQWRLDPAAAERHLAAALAAAGTGRTDDEHAQPLAQSLLLQGRIAEAARLLGPGAQDPAEEATSLLDVVLDTGAAAAERLLRSATLTEATLVPVVQAVQCLLHSEHPERAVPWSRTLLEDAERREAPGWTAVFATLQAQAQLRLGDLEAAVAAAALALGSLGGRTESALGYAAGAVLVRAYGAMGRYTEATELCDRRLPENRPAGVHELGFLRARGLHQMLGNQPQAALADFLTVGRLMAEWGIDRPAYLPWRTDAAEALLRLGRPQQAEQLVREQLGLPDARRPWVRGTSLHLRALTVSAPRQRIALLQQAVDELHRSGDRLQTARAMADLGQSTQAEGTSATNGAATVRAAWNLAKECRATALCKEILPDAPIGEPVRDQPPGPGRAGPETARLSNSEQRVATLAAQGLTNREISAKLYLTVSTVEQHLTRVYRKLQVSCRGDLPMDLALGNTSTWDQTLPAQNA